MSFDINQVNKELKNISLNTLEEYLTSDRVFHQYSGLLFIKSNLEDFDLKYFENLYSFIPKFENFPRIKCFDKLMTTLFLLFDMYIDESNVEYVSEFLNTLCPLLTSLSEGQYFGIVTAGIIIGLYFPDDSIKVKKLFRILFDIVLKSKKKNACPLKKVEAVIEAFTYLIPYIQEEMFEEFEQDFISLFSSLFNSSDFEINIKAAILYAVAIENIQSNGIRSYINSVRSIETNNSLKGYNEKRASDVVGEVDLVFSNKFKYSFKHGLDQISYTNYSPYIILESIKRLTGEFFSAFIDRSPNIRSMLGLVDKSIEELKEEMKMRKVSSKTNDKKRRLMLNEKTRQSIYEDE